MGSEQNRYIAYIEERRPVQNMYCSVFNVFTGLGIVGDVVTRARLMNLARELQE